MAERPESQGPDDLLDGDEPFDARQWAMHGLLSAYFDSHTAASERRVKAIFERIHAEAAGQTPEPVAVAREPRRRTVIRLPEVFRSAARRWVISGGLAAAIVVIAVGVLMVRSAAVAKAIEDVATQDIPAVEVTLPNPQLEMQYRREIEQYAAERNARLRDVETLTRELEDPSLDDERRATVRSELYERADAVLSPWHQVYRRLVGLGDWEDAIGEIERAFEFSAKMELAQRVFICLDDLGSTFLMMGDWQAARETYLESLARRDEYVETQFARWREEWRNARLAETRVQSVVPLYWRVSRVAALTGNLDAARNWHARATEALRQWLIGVCEAADASAAPPESDAASLIELYASLPLCFRDTPEWPEDGQIVHARDRFGGYAPWPVGPAVLRQHLYREARLRRMEGDYVGARAALRDAARVQYWPVRDESRLKFREPLEGGRIAMCMGEYAEALQQFDLAAENTGPLEFWDRDGKDHRKRAIPPLMLAELNVLRAAALLGAGASDEAAGGLLEGALATRDAFADRLTGEPREDFLRQFQVWDELAEAAR